VKLNEEQIRDQHEEEHDHGLELTEPESQEAQERSSTTVRVVYEAVRREGEEELKRTSSALWWSGLAAGLSMGFSLMIQGVLLHDLPDAPWRRLVASFGYSAGFVVVILGRQQLFTENTLTPILPLLRRKSWPSLLNVGRLWAVVLIANLVGCTIIAWLLAGTSAFPADVRASFAAAAREATDLPFGLALLRGIFAGWLMALLVWLLPFAEHARFFVIITMTWMISICGFTHIVAGSVETIFLTWSGIHSWQQAVGGYIVPVLLGNIIGGVSLVAALNHAQVVS
jgi:formate/nitrite transporter FocA (FNT family)